MRNLESKELDEFLITALQALGFLIRNRREVHHDGLYIKLDDYVDSKEFSNILFNCAGILDTIEIPELTHMLELRILNLRKNAIEKKLQDIRGENGK